MNTPANFQDLANNLPRYTGDTESPKASISVPVTFSAGDLPETALQQLRLLCEDAQAGFQRLRTIGAARRKFHPELRLLLDEESAARDRLSKTSPDHGAWDETSKRVDRLRNDIANRQSMLERLDREHEEIEAWLWPVDRLRGALLEQLNVRAWNLFPDLDPALYAETEYYRR